MDEPRLLGRKKLRDTPEVKEAKYSIGRFLAYQWAEVVVRLRMMQWLADESGPPGPQGIVLRAQNGTYIVTVGKDYLPARLVYQASSGADSGLEVLYSNYQAFGPARYPMTMAVQYPDSPQHRMEVRLTELTPNAKLQSKDFPQ